MCVRGRQLIPHRTFAIIKTVVLRVKDSCRYFAKFLEGCPLATAMAERPFVEVLGVAWSGERLREIREAVGLSQKALSVKAQCDQTAVSLWELEKRTPGAAELFRLSDALGVKCDTFREEPGTPIHFLRRPKKLD